MQLSLRDPRLASTAVVSPILAVRGSAWWLQSMFRIGCHGFTAREANLAVLSASPSLQLSSGTAFSFGETRKKPICPGKVRWHRAEEPPPQGRLDTGAENQFTQNAARAPRLGRFGRRR